ncbi:barstar family protein [Fusobacterium sp. PH5-44]|uniref:barstar family protein n=1 Tax=unclassified Fusobacterium TaxID=2648384 RepID=UPI003D226C34
MKENNIMNKIIKLNDKKELYKSISKIKTSYFKSEFDGKKIQNWEDYIKAIGDAFNFPKFSRYPTYDGYIDWMKDLSWIKYDTILLIINNYNDFMKNNEKEKINFFEMIEWILLRRNERIGKKNFSQKILLVYLIN